MRWLLGQAIDRLTQSSRFRRSVLRFVLDHIWAILQPKIQRENEHLQRKIERSEKKLRDSLETHSQTVSQARNLESTLRDQKKRILHLERLLKKSDRRIARMEHLLAEERKAAELDPTIQGMQELAAHVSDRFQQSAVVEHPFPHIVVEDLLPDHFYESLVVGIPEMIFFAEEKNSKHDFQPCADLAPRRTRQVWRFMDQQVCSEVLMPELLKCFQPYLDSHLDTLFGPTAVARAKAMTMQTFDGRIMRRRPGYYLAPHQDPARYFITALLYLPISDDDDLRWGTQLFGADDPYTVSVRNIFYAKAAGVSCTLAKTAPYRRNTLLAFLNSRSLHGADIPIDEAPEDLERYSFQFYVGPNPEEIRELFLSLPEEQRAIWQNLRKSGAHREKRQNHLN